MYSNGRTSILLLQVPDGKNLHRQKSQGCSFSDEGRVMPLPQCSPVEG